MAIVQTLRIALMAVFDSMKTNAGPVFFKRVWVTEEGLSGRTTVFPDPLYENLDVFSYFWGLLKSHEYIDLLMHE